MLIYLFKNIHSIKNIIMKESHDHKFQEGKT